MVKRVTDDGLKDGPTGIVNCPRLPHYTSIRRRFDCAFFAKSVPQVFGWAESPADGVIRASCASLTI